jgi:hypothetical protein
MRIQHRGSAFHSGQIVSISGHYKISHQPHALGCDIALLKGNYFPSCAICKAPVQFRLTQGLRVESAQERFRLLGEPMPARGTA